MIVTVGVRELRSHLSTWLDRARRGESIVVTERGVPVARLEPPGDSSRLDELIRLGLVTPAARPKSPRLPAPLAGARGSVSDLVSEQRE